MRRSSVLIMSILSSLSACANNHNQPHNMSGIPAVFLPAPTVKLQVIGDNNGVLSEYPVNADPAHYQAYIQATQNERYQLRISNNSDQRVGVVIAVDGRNIISGEKSYLQNNERMYILAPHSADTYSGWRTSANQVNRFYFTEASDSYAAAWGDNSAMGVIALAVYAEQPRTEERQQMSDSTASPAPAAAESLNRPKKQAGTGFGENTYSPTVTVNFMPQPGAIEKAFLKYEWHETLCQKRILPNCQSAPPPSQNRFWPDENKGFAPAPPRPRRY